MAGTRQGVTDAGSTPGSVPATLADVDLEERELREFDSTSEDEDIGLCIKKRNTKCGLLVCRPLGVNPAFTAFAVPMHVLTIYSALPTDIDILYTV